MPRKREKDAPVSENTTMSIKRITLEKAKRLGAANKRSRPQQIEFLIDEAYKAHFGSNDLTPQ